MIGTAIGFFLVVFSLSSLSLLSFRRDRITHDKYENVVVYYHDSDDDYVESLLVDVTPDNVLYLPLSEDDLRSNGIVDRDGDHVTRNLQNTNSLSILSKFGLNFGALSVDEPQTTPTQETAIVFQPDDYSFSFSQPQEYLSHGNSCELEISNILPPDYMPRSSLPKSIYANESKLLQEFRHVDADIRHSEARVTESEKYLRMRDEVLEDTEIVYPSDHLSVQYTRLVYLNISDRERRVISMLYDRMNRSKCMIPILEKYQRMTEELNIDKELLWNQTKELILQEMEVNGQLTDSLDEMIEDRVRTDQYQKRRQRLNRYFSVKYFSSEQKYCDGCPIPSGIKHFKAIFQYPNHYLIRKWIGNEETNEIYSNSNPVFVPDDATPDVTGIAAATYNRLFSIQQLLYRWRGNLTIVLQCPKTEEQHVIHYINTHFFPDRFVLVLFLTDEEHAYNNVFPVNYLRNLAIRNIHTTHFLVLDMDLRLTTNAYAEVMRLPKEFFHFSRTVFILPVFFFNHTLLLNNCNSVDDCAALANEYQPEDKSELIACMYHGHCISNKRLVRTHMYVMPEWYVTHQESPASRIRCFLTNFMEPYMLVRYQKTTPLFHEEFVDYGYNKVQYFENLRQMGYSFFILNHAFAMDFPHPDSDFRVRYHEVIHSDETNPMKTVYAKLQKRFNQDYRYVHSSKVCFTKQKSYYQELSHVS